MTPSDERDLIELLKEQGETLRVLGEGHRALVGAVGQLVDQITELETRLGVIEGRASS